MPSAKSSSGLLIKGYIPIRLTLPGLDGVGLDDTFFFVKEHHAASSEKAGTNSTLFVANAPFVPGIPTKVLLKSIFERYADVNRVTVVKNPRSTDTPVSSTSWTDQAKYPSFFHGTIESEGKFAHVVFSSSKDMRKAIRSVREVMGDKKAIKEGGAPGIQLSKLHIQTLISETRRIQKVGEDGDDEESDVENEELEQDSLTGIAAVAERYRTSYLDLSRSALLEECNEVMESFEDAEEADRRAREAASNEPDEDGFVTVTYASQSVGSKREMEQHVGGANKRKAHKRARKKKPVNGSSELQDFYRFQMKASRRKNVQDLRKRFEEDLAKVKKMKEERQYRPF